MPIRAPSFATSSPGSKSRNRYRVRSGTEHQVAHDDLAGHALPALSRPRPGAPLLQEREAASFDHDAALQHRESQAAASDAGCSGCAGSKPQVLQPQADAAPTGAIQSQLRHWPVQIQLAPLTAPYFDGANLLVAADCAAYAHGNFHSRFMRNRVPLIGCPKLDPVDYAEKLTEIIRRNNIKSVTIVRMEVPCCGGLERAAINALQASGKFIPWQVVTLSVQGDVVDSLD